MKKHNEGYALALVLVVLVVVCLVAVSILSASLSNLKSQQASIARMQAQYEAQGAIEKVVAQLSKISEYELITGKSAKDAICKTINTLCEGVAEGKIVVADTTLAATDVPAAGETTSTNFFYEFNLVSTSGSVQIICTLKLEGNIDPNLLDSESGTTSFLITNSSIKYIAYEITTTESAEGGVTE